MDAPPPLLTLTLASTSRSRRGVAIQDRQDLESVTECDVGDIVESVMPRLDRESVGLREGALVEIKTETTGVGDDNVRDVSAAVVDSECGRCSLLDASLGMKDKGGQ